MGNDLYEQVFYSLDLIEKDYFGLQFTDANHVKHWLDPTKAIKKQVKSMNKISKSIKLKRKFKYFFFVWFRNSWSSVHISLES